MMTKEEIKELVIDAVKGNLIYPWVLKLTYNNGKVIYGAFEQNLGIGEDYEANKWRFKILYPANESRVIYCNGDEIETINPVNIFEEMAKQKML